MENEYESEKEIDPCLRKCKLLYKQRIADAIERAKNSESDVIIIHCKNLLSIASKKLADVIEQSELKSIPCELALKNIEEYYEIKALFKDNEKVQEYI